MPDPNRVVSTQYQKDVPPHLWPDPAKVRCEDCGESVHKIEVTAMGNVRWIDVNGHNISDQMLRKAQRSFGA